VNNIFDAVLRKAKMYLDCGIPRPEWLQKQIDSVHSGSLCELMEGLQDEIDHINNAKYNPRRPGATSGQSN
jgi:hypothetical protein